MTWSSRPYQTPADLRLMQAFTSACWRADWPAPAAHPGDLDWWSRDSVSGALPLAERVRLWFEGEPDASGLVAWGWFGLPGDLDLLVRPDFRATELVGEVADWAADRAAAGSGSGALGTDAIQAFVADAQPAVIASLEGAGFHAVDGVSMVGFTRRFEGWSVPEPDVPAGFVLRALESADIEARVAVGKLAFPNSQLTPGKYDVVRHSTLYRASLDRVAFAPGGRLAGFALGWLDPATLAIELEPVAVHPAWQRRGLGRAVCLEAIRAGVALGATHGLILAEDHNQAALGLYGGLGYEITTRIRPYRRALTAELSAG